MKSLLKRLLIGESVGGENIIENEPKFTTIVSGSRELFHVWVDKVGACRKPQVHAVMKTLEETNPRLIKFLKAKNNNRNCCL